MKTDQNKTRSEIQLCLDGLTDYLASYEQHGPTIKRYSFSYERGMWVAVAKTPEPEPGLGYYERNLRKLLIYIENHYSDKIDVPTAADIIGLSHSEFSKFFKKQMGQNFVPYTNQVRIANACRKLIATEYSCERVGFECGFSSQSYFKRVFQQIHGITPKQYRTKYRPQTFLERNMQVLSHTKQELK